MVGERERRACRRHGHAVGPACVVAAGEQAGELGPAALRHGPYELLGPGVLAMIMAGDPATYELNVRLAEDVRRLGAKAALIEPGASESVFRLPDVAERLRPIVEILPVQMLTLALAASRGQEAGRFQQATKITDTE